MADIALQKAYSRFISYLVAALRRASLYPAKHPAVMSSIKDIFLGLKEILNTKDHLTLSLSSDNKIIIENEAVDERDVDTQGLMPCFIKLNIENITFGSGITENEIEELIKIMSLKEEQAKNLGDIAKAVLDRGMAHVKIDQFAYIKVDKEKEVVVAGKEEADALEKLRARLKDYVKGKIKDKEDVQLLRQDIFGSIAAGFKENKKIDAGLKNIFKKLFLSSEDKDGILLELKNSLVGTGCSSEEADIFVGRLKEQVLKKIAVKESAFPAGEVEKIKTENDALKEKLKQLQEELDKHAQEFKGLEAQGHRLKSEKQKLENVMHNMSEGVVVVDAQGNLLMINPIAETLLGVSKQDIGRPIKELVKDEHLLAMVKNLPQGQDASMQKDIELFSRNESTKRVLKTSSAVVEDPDGNAVGMVTVLNDITRQKELEKLKSDFVSNVSHELRSPLVAIEKSVSLILSKTAGEISPDQEQFLSIAERNLKRLALLINDLLDLSKLEAGKMAIKLQETAIGKIIDDCIMTFANWAKTKSIKLEARIPEKLPLLNIDPDRIIQVLSNLISNALKFTPENGSITVEAKYDTGREKIEVSVADSGIGIADENLNKIFDRFYQVGEKKPSDIGGTGLGLSIAKEIVELHSGKIWAESQAGSGAKFIFALSLTGTKGD